VSGRNTSGSCSSAGRWSHGAGDGRELRIKSISDEKLVADMLVGDLQRVLECPKLGFAVEQGVPGDVYDAYERLVHDGFDSRLIAP
jgi:hypothetical protein